MNSPAISFTKEKLTDEGRSWVDINMGLLEHEGVSVLQAQAVVTRFVQDIFDRDARMQPKITDS